LDVVARKTHTRTERESEREREEREETYADGFGLAFFHGVDHCSIAF
jgi:predicted glutamine amidotransferase